MIVVDTNIIAYLLIEGDHSLPAKKLLVNDSEWTAPRLWRSEFRNVLSRYMRHNLLDLKSAQLLMEEAQNLLLGNEYEVSSVDILSLVSQSKCSAYDCEYVSLAQNLALKLYTSDKKILREFPNDTISLKSISI
jgi:predicted nucleic acid-binding protein